MEAHEAECGINAEHRSSCSNTGGRHEQSWRRRRGGGTVEASRVIGRSKGDDRSCWKERRGVPRGMHARSEDNVVSEALAGKRTANNK